MVYQNVCFRVAKMAKVAKRASSLEIVHHPCTISRTMSLARSAAVARPPSAALAAVVVGLVVALLVGFSSPLLASTVLLGVTLALAILRWPTLSLFGLVALAYLLPFAVIPFRIGVQLTMLDAVLLLGYGSALARSAVRRTPIRLGTVGRLLVVLVGLMALAHLLSLPYAGGVDLTRKVLKLFAAMLVFVLALNLIEGRQTLARVMQAIVLAAALESALGVALYLAPRDLVVRLLSTLRVVGYPSGPDVLRFLPGENDTYSDILRATSTSLDPNVLGGVLMLAAAIALAQLFGPKPLLPRPVLAASSLLTVACMLMTHSRSSWVGLTVALAGLAIVRYRRIWLIAVPTAVVVLATPPGRALLSRVLSGFAGQDRAASMRLDEYRNALEIIQQAPLLGIGFGAPPSIDLAPGVSSMYLTIAETSGLPALLLFLLAMGALLLRARQAQEAAPDETLGGALVSLQTAIVAALVAGLFDHYFSSAVFFHTVALFWLLCGLVWSAAGMAASGRNGQAVRSVARL